MEIIYNWWKNCYSSKQKEIKNSLDEWHSEKFGEAEGDGWLDELNRPDTLKERNLFDNHHQLEKRLDDEEEEMLIRLIKIRHFLWT